MPILVITKLLFGKYIQFIIMPIYHIKRFRQKILYFGHQNKGACSYMGINILPMA